MRDTINRIGDTIGTPPDPNIAMIVGGATVVVVFFLYQTIVYFMTNTDELLIVLAVTAFFVSLYFIGWAVLRLGPLVVGIIDHFLKPS